MSGPTDAYARLADAAVREGRLEELDQLVRAIDPALARRLQSALTNGLKERNAEEARGDDGPQIVRLAEILARPDLLEPPRTVVPRLAWSGRVTLLAGREKVGKSTLAAGAEAAVSAGAGLFGASTPCGPVLLLALEEHMGDVARRLQAFRADPERVWVLDRIEEPLADLAGAVQHVGPALVVVDTLAAFTAPLGLEPGSSTDWTPVMAGIARVARDTETAIVLLHHASKADGSYRDSTAIGAGVDVILEAKRGTEETVQVKARGRFPVEDFTVRLLGSPARPRLALAAGELGLDARVLFYVDRNPGASKRAVCGGVEGRAQDILNTVDQLLGRGLVEDRGDGRG